MARRTRRRSIATATITVAFVVLGGFLILTTNMERVFTRWQDAAEFSVYLSDAASPRQRAAIEQTLARERASCGASRSVSKEEALRRFKQNFGALAEAAGDLPANPLPASVEVRLRPNADPADVAVARRASRPDCPASPMCATTVNGFSG